MILCLDAKKKSVAVTRNIFKLTRPFAKSFSKQPCRTAEQTSPLYEMNRIRMNLASCSGVLRGDKPSETRTKTAPCRCRVDPTRLK